MPRRMKPLRPLVVAALPIRSPNDVWKAFGIRDVDLVELRVDYMEDPMELDYSALKGKNVIVTLRDVAEGGVKEHPVEVKLKLLKILSELDILFDVEMEFVEKYGVDYEGNIVSMHIMDPARVDLTGLKNRVKKFLDKAFVVKIASMAFPGYRALFASLLELGDNVAVMPMSKDVALSRVIALDRIAFTLMGSKLLYCSIEAPTAPGQPRCRDVLEILRKAAELFQVS